MKELDFDELDRAVNSLMTNVPKSAPARDEEKEKTLDIKATLDDDATPSFDKIEEVAATAVNEPKTASIEPESPDAAAPVPSSSSVSPRTSTPVTTPAARRGGRFMDVVHPSADMTKPDTPRPVSRQGVTLEPLGTSQKIADIVPKKREVAEKVEEPEKKPETQKEEPVIATVPEPTMPEPEKVEEKTPASDWPDPLDMMPSKESEEKEVEMPEEPKIEEPAAPLTSPFLPDTKVEKRPLGGAVPEEEETTAEEPAHPPVIPVDETPKTVDDPNAQLPANPNDVEVQLPEELSGDLMAVEADTTHDELKQAHESKFGETTAKPKAAEPETAPVEPVTPAGPTSISQQYREEPSTGDKDNGAIYDTDTYHQPLSHPAKKKSGWMWVIWIALILLLGAGGGAALYFLGLV